MADSLHKKALEGEYSVGDSRNIDLEVAAEADCNSRPDHRLDDADDGGDETLWDLNSLRSTGQF